MYERCFEMGKLKWVLNHVTILMANSSQSDSTLLYVYLKYIYIYIYLHDFNPEKYKIVKYLILL